MIVLKSFHFVLEQDKGIDNDDWKVFEKLISKLLDFADLFQIVVNKQNEIFYKSFSTSKFLPQSCYTVWVFPMYFLSPVCL